MTINTNFQDIEKIVEGEWLYQLAERLYPICRSITGNGVRETLSILKEFVPLTIEEIPSGTKVLDWEIPNEWNIHDAWIKNQDGVKIVDFNKSNLHVLNYSLPIDKHIRLAELKEHLYTILEYPDWIPYRTSYYNPQWGFCMKHNDYENLKDGEYQIFIDSEIKPGSLTYGEFLIPGKTEKEVLFICHICHPSLCNDNLSGIVLATKLAALLQNMNLEYSYRFLFVPGTIGSITWLSVNEDKLGKIRHGIVLSLLGDSTAFNYKRSRQGNATIDQIMEYLINHETDSNIMDFSPYGYDERQFCSPGFDLPVGRLTRKPFGEFPEYHTSGDNLDFISAENLNNSLILLRKAVSIIEENKKYLNLFPKGEPQLGRRGLYSSVGGQSHNKDHQMALLWVLNLSDGNHSLLDIVKKSGLNFDTIKIAAEDLENACLLAEFKQA